MFGEMFGEVLGILPARSSVDLSHPPAILTRSEEGDPPGSLRSTHAGLDGLMCLREHNIL